MVIHLKAVKRACGAPKQTDKVCFPPNGPYWKHVLTHSFARRMRQNQESGSSSTRTTKRTSDEAAVLAPMTTTIQVPATAEGPVPCQGAAANAGHQAHGK